MAEKEVKKTTKVSLNPKVWELAYNADLIAQVLSVYFSNERKGTSNAKTRGDVSGGGKKPWKQKGTGRARVGSIRSPLWVGGGVTFTPNARNWKKSINKKMANKATCIMLSRRLKEEKVQFMDITKDEIKNTRGKVLEMTNGKTTIITNDEGTILAVRNHSDITIVSPEKLNAKHVVSSRNLLVDNEVVKILEDRLTNGK